MGVPSGWRYDTPADAWESEWNDAQSRGPTSSGDGVTYYRSGRGSEFALDYQSDTSKSGWGGRGIPPQYQSLLASAGANQRGLLHGRNIYQAPAAAATTKPTATAAEPKLDTKRISEAKDRADAYRIPANPSYKSSGDGIDAAASYGKDANDYFTSVTDYFKGQADLQANEIGAATDYYTKKFVGKVPSLKDPMEWYRALKGDIQSA